MADEQYRWLDSDTAERLLSGESPDVVEPADRERAARLAHTLGSLTSAGPQDGAELPGEAAALAAFRKVRAERGFAGAPVGDAGEVGDVVQLGVPVVSAGVSRRQRAARFGLAAVLALGVAGVRPWWPGWGPGGRVRPSRGRPCPPLPRLRLGSPRGVRRCLSRGSVPKA
ncbi:hypothetical protein F3K43_16355 [Streptomyces sp. LBUM 1476]|nr:hypothetical protein [Streptomyces sp. LBUM 1476]